MANDICLFERKVIVAMWGADSNGEGTAGTEMVMEATSMDSPMSSSIPIMLRTIPKAIWNKCVPWPLR